MKKTLLCDTIFDEVLKEKMRTIPIHGESDGSKDLVGEVEHFRYRAVTDETLSWVLLREEGNKVFMIPEYASLHPNRFKEEMLIDLMQRKAHPGQFKEEESSETRFSH